MSNKTSAFERFHNDECECVYENLLTMNVISVYNEKILHKGNFTDNKNRRLTNLCNHCRSRCHALKRSPQPQTKRPEREPRMRGCYVCLLRNELRDYNLSSFPCDMQVLRAENTFSSKFITQFETSFLPKLFQTTRPDGMQLTWRPTGPLDFKLPFQRNRNGALITLLNTRPASHGLYEHFFYTKLCPMHTEARELDKMNQYRSRLGNLEDTCCRQFFFILSDPFKENFQSIEGIPIN